MYLSWKGVLATTIIGTGAGAGIGAAYEKPGVGAGIGFAAGLFLPLLAEGIEGAFDGARAEATTALKQLRSAIKAKDADGATKAQAALQTALAKVVTPPAVAAPAK